MKEFQTDKERKELQQKIKVYKLVSLYLTIEDMEKAEKADPLWHPILNWTRMLNSIPFNEICTKNPISKVTTIYKLKNSINTVKFAYAPLSQKPTVHVIATGEVGQKIVKRKNFVWTEVMHVNKAVHEYFKQNFITAKKQKNHSINHIAEYYNSLSSDYASTFHANLVIGKVNNVVGWSLFTLKFIPKGSLILVYTGKLACETPEHDAKSDDQYMFTWENIGSNRLGILQSKGEFPYLYHAYISAKNFGNYARFMQHAPLKEKLNQYRFFNNEGNVDDTIKDNIAHANVQPSCARYFTCPVVIVEATEDIPENSPILFDYSDDYWNGRCPSFFKLDGTVDNHRFEKKPVPQNVENVTNNEENSNDNCEVVLTRNSCP